MSPYRDSQPYRIAIVGGGPAGLFAAELLSRRGLCVDLFDAMPSVGRKFLQAGRGGLNLTHSENREPFVSRYGTAGEWMAPLLAEFGSEQLRSWAAGLGIETFIGSSGRVFPLDMKAAPLLRAWLQRLRHSGVRFHLRHRWCGWDAQGALRFTTPSGEVTHAADVTLLALGGGSWARLGSDGAWVNPCAEAGIPLTPLKPANCGFECDWSEHFRERFAGAPVKGVVLSWQDELGQQQRQGEFVITRHGVEGSLIYGFAARLREHLALQGEAIIRLDLLPGRDLARVERELRQPRGSKSLANHLRSRLGIEGVKMGLLRECLSQEVLSDPAQLAAAIKALPVPLLRTRPLDEAISTAGGIRLEALDHNLMIKTHPGLFCAGEMLDWEAPTGGYLLTGCFATAHGAAQGMLAWLDQRPAR